MPDVRINYPRDPAKQVANRELISLMVQHGLEPLLEALENPINFTRAGRLKHTTLARNMNLSITDLKRMMDRAREICQGY